MTNHGECPKCGKRVLHVRIETAVATVEEESKGRVLTFSCIHCNAVLGAQMDARGKPRPRRSGPPAGG